MGEPSRMLTIEDAERIAVGMGTVLGVCLSRESLSSLPAGFVAFCVCCDVLVLEAQPSGYTVHGQKVASRRPERTTSSG